MSQTTELNRVLFELSEERELISLDRARNEIPKCQGLYSIFVDSADSVPSPFKEELKERNTKLLYLGQASKSLEDRLVKQDLEGGTSTFFRGIGAILGYRPPRGSLRGKSNQNNYRFSPRDKKKIMEWISLHLRARWCECDPNQLEQPSIERRAPLLNTTYNPRPFLPLATLREECRKYARS